MRKTVSIIHLGPGKVGLHLIKVLHDNRKFLENTYNVSIAVVGIFDSKKGIYNKNGVSLSNIPEQLHKSSILSNSVPTYISQTTLPSILIDTSASAYTYNLYKQQLQLGGYVVISNKKILAQDYASWKKLMKFQNCFFFETTVGAGLPIISTIKELQVTGDQVIKIEGCFSGTLGYICSQLNQGVAFSKAVTSAMNEGFTEPDPRDDLGGVDVARKALILSRLIGHQTELNDILIEQLYPETFNKMSLSDFLINLPSLDTTFDKMVAIAEKKSTTIRYLATIENGVCKVGLQEVKKDSNLGQLTGPDNMIVITTKRYLNNPITIQGPGAGIEVTAAGVLGDVIKCIERIT